MLSATYHRHRLIFRHPAGTSRGVLHHRDSFFLLLHDTLNPETTGIGECGVIPGLSPDDRPGFEERIISLCDEINQTSSVNTSGLENWPSIRFALETALFDLTGGGQRILFESQFTSGEKPININGLIWMGEEYFMLKQIDEKLAAGYRVIKIKVGAIDFDTELKLIAGIRKHFGEDQITIRLDANGAFSPGEADEKLKHLSDFAIHSIEQPIKQGNPATMAEICRTSPIPVALDEELINISGSDNKKKLLEQIKPQYIILKPSLLGGFYACREWIELAAEKGIGWWITSALESNIGLNAIAQWTATLGNDLPQGLGTGSLYTNNIPAPLEAANGVLHYLPGKPWDLAFTGIYNPHPAGS
ncbi:o-succinylbenzoate synthase [bioreactor metagenome]|jgi:o-succinylbenzoate synthase|uniref:O-succinylbenzoate synthase n=1 Tax=bioreactor metagenome TaxID=1076179 RepID=A0A644V6Z4_9ZZZZ|nr:o-succinylbenzoate synthase [Lentimicrobium sp.]MEA5110840.1 o-succinylbenzoate synthase [Lentimicrobium sp.]